MTSGPSASLSVAPGSNAPLAPGLYRWTRKGFLSFGWNASETFDRLVMAPLNRVRLEEESQRFAPGASAFQSLRLPWRRGAFFYGDSGVGKTAASRGLARALNWPHLTLPAHEVLSPHLLERALSELIRYSRVVIVLEDVERVIGRMENEEFFSILDHAMERCEGVYWVATSRHPDIVPKTQLVRPGRFDYALRFAAPNSGLRREIIQSQLLPFLLPLPREPELFGGAQVSEVVPFQVTPLLSDGVEGAEAPVALAPPPAVTPPAEPGALELDELTRRTEGFDFAHFEELRALCAGLLLAGQEEAVWPGVMQYIQDQLISGDRLGGVSDETERLRARVDAIDPRILMAALDQTDVFKRLIEKVIGDAAEKAQLDDDAE